MDYIFITRVQSYNNCIDLLIEMGENMLVSNMEVYESWQAPIIDAEQYLMDTCKEYYIDYTTCECKERPVTEGLVSGFVNLVKTIFQKAIAFLVKTWKAIVGFFKKIFNKVLEFFKRLFNIKTDKKFTTGVGIISKPGVVETKKYADIGSIKQAFQKSFNTISQEIQNLSRQNINHTKKMEQITVSRTTESYIPVNENIGYNKTTTEIERDSKTNDPKLKEYDVLVNDVIGPKALEANLQMYRDAGYSDEQINALKAEVKKVASMQGSSALAHLSVTTLSALDVKLANQVIESQNVCEAYNALKMNSLKKLKEYINKVSHTEDFIKHANLITNVNTINGILHMADDLSQFGVSESEIERYVGCGLYPSFDKYETTEKKEAAIRKFLKLRINWNNGIIESLRAMVIRNQNMLGLTTQQVIELTKDLESGNIDSTKAILDANKDKIISSDKTIVDGRKFGLGTIIMSEAIAKDADNENSTDPLHKGFYLSISSIMTNDSAITYLTKYDCTVLAHGHYVDTEKYGRLWIIEQCKTPNGSKIQEQYTVGGEPFILVESLIDKDTNKVIMEGLLDLLVKEGFKRINIISCNPGGVKLSSRFATNKKVFIRMSMTSTMQA